MPKTTNARAIQTKPLGILGGGQLARMLALKCHELGLPVAIYSENQNDPAAQVVNNWHQGSVSDSSKLEAFLQACSVATFESEFMDADLLARISKKSGVAVFPSPKTMGALQDRLTQKMLLERHGLPTSPFHGVADSRAARVAFETLGGKVVFKKRRFGYDGYGTFVVRSQEELEAFLPLIAKTETGFIAEKFIPFKRELAFVVARSRTKTKAARFARFPFVETFQENARCLWVKGPIASRARLEKLGRSVEKFLDDLSYVGVMGIELFETTDGFIVNELAPRVHNSGHYTLDATSLDQFSAHILSVLGAPLEKPRLLSKGFAMMNLLGENTKTPRWTVPAGVHLHWYGKSENRAGRKMGHYNVLAATAARALAIAKKARASFQV